MFDEGKYNNLGDENQPSDIQEEFTPEENNTEAIKEIITEGSPKSKDNPLIHIFRQLIKLFNAPAQAFENLRGTSIGWPFLVLLIVFLVYVVASAVIGYINTKDAWEDSLFMLSLFFPFFNIFSAGGLFLILLMIPYAIFLMIEVFGSWALSFFWSHIFAVIYRGKGKWHELAVGYILVQIFGAILAAPLLLIIYGIFIFLGEYINVAGYLALAIAVAFLGWIIFIQSRAVKVYYKLSNVKSVLVILTPILITLAIAAGYYFYYDYSLRPTYIDDLSSEEMEFDWEDFEVDDNLNTNASRNLNFSLNTNFNWNTNFDLTNFQASPADELSMDFLWENSIAMLEEVQAIETTNANDQARQEDLISLKYELKAYYEYYQEYPQSDGSEQLDGSDSLNTALAEFLGYTTNYQDPESPDYYYGYESDGQSFSLTSYLTETEEVYKITDQDL